MRQGLATVQRKQTNAAPKTDTPQVQFQRQLADMPYQAQVAGLRPPMPVALSSLAGPPVQRMSVQFADPPPKPQNDGEYQALAGYGAFQTNVTSFGLPPALALSCWKNAMDQLYQNQAEWQRLKSDPTAMNAWVDSDPARMGFNTMAEALLQAKPLDTSKSYALWSGKPSQEYAQTQGCEVLESTQLGKLFDNVRIVFSEWDVQKTLWRAISDRYAREIGTIMEGKKIQVFQRKLGDIFAQVESVALEQIGQASGVPPQYDFHPLTTPGVFGGEAAYEMPYANGPWRDNLKTAASGDEAKAKTAAEAEGLQLFKYSGPVPVSDLQDGGPAARGAAEAKITGQNDDTLTKCNKAKAALDAQKASSGTPPH